MSLVYSIVTLLVISASGTMLAACDQKEKEDRSTSTYSVFFISPKAKAKSDRIYLGTVKGISSCKYAASSYYAHRLWIGKGWDYVCCLRTKKDECAEEHRYED